jgi:hypothetical protein
MIFNIRDLIEFKLEEQIILKAHIAGIEHCDPWSPKLHFAFLLPPEVKNEEIRIGSEILFHPKISHQE